MKPLFMVILLVTLSACGQQAVILPTETSIPTVVSSTPVPTSTSIPVTVTPSPMPTQPIIPIITADPVQVERWKEYEDALAIALFPPKYNPRSPSEFLCEWEILGRSDQEVYVWTVCMSIFSVVSTGLPYHAEMPAVIHIGADGAVQSVEVPGGGSNYASDIRQMFPPDSQEKYFDGLIHFQELTDHLNWRREHLEELPLIVLSSTFIPVTIAPTITPTRPGEALITPDGIQVERWREYQIALAKNVPSDLPPEEVLCEWEILGQSGSDVYVWAVCKGKLTIVSLPAVIHLETDGAVQSVERPTNWSRDIPRLFPPDVIEKFAHYHAGRAGQLIEHIEWRRTHPDEPPLIVLSTTPIP